MNYLRHANKHISSSHGLYNKKSRIRIWQIMGLFIGLILLSFVLRSPLTNLIFSIRSLVVPTTPTEITLSQNALDAQLQAYQTENEELKNLLRKTGVILPIKKEVINEDLVAPEDVDSIEIQPVSATTSTTSVVLGPDTQVIKTKKMNLHTGDVLATVLIRPPQSPYDAIVISAGSAQGISTGDIVYAFNGFPIGTIVSVDKNLSTAQLFSAPGTKTEVYIGTSTLATIAEGKGGGNFYLKLPKVTDIHVGDMVARRLVDIEVFSSIESVEANEGEAYTYAFFKLPVNLNSLVYVLVKKDLTR